MAGRGLSVTAVPQSSSGASSARVEHWYQEIAKSISLQTQAAIITDSQIKDDNTAFWRNTALTGDRRLWVNDSGTLYGIPFSMIERTTIPSTSDVPNGGWVVWKNTTLSGGVAANTVKLWVNDNGTMKSVTLA